MEWCCWVAAVLVSGLMNLVCPVTKNVVNSVDQQTISHSVIKSHFCITVLATICNHKGRYVKDLIKFGTNFRVIWDHFRCKPHKGDKWLIKACCRIILQLYCLFNSCRVTWQLITCMASPLNISFGSSAGIHQLKYISCVNLCSIGSSGVSVWINTPLPNIDWNFKLTKLTITTPYCVFLNIVTGWCGFKVTERKNK